MDIVRILPENLVNQIKAGEVVERPANVVKELIENSIDSGADHIFLSVKNGGRDLIRVKDNGCGMSSGDAERSLQKHATSKIYSQEDIFSIATLGFRGEALSSMGSVAVLTLYTRREESETGFKILMENSKIDLREETSQATKGTVVEVARLFYNVPARFKFLKTNTTENKYILQEFQRIALPNPKVAFTYKNNGETIQSYPKETSPERIIKVFGEPSLERYIPVSEETSSMKISGYITKIDYGQKNNAHQFVFVNRRFVKSPMINKAVRQPYERLMEYGKYPSFVLFIELDPSDININIHPKKTEIKFENESSIFQIIQAVVRKALGQFQMHKNPEIDLSKKFFEPTTPNIPKSGNSNKKNISQEISDIYTSPLEHRTSTALDPVNTSPSDSWEEEILEHLAIQIPDKKSLQNTLDLTQDHPAYLQEKQLWEKGVIQKFSDKYALNITLKDIFIIHIRRMYESFFYDRLQNERDIIEKISQKMLIPLELKFAANQVEIIGKMLPYLNAVGLDLNIRKASGRVIVKSTPTFIGSGSVQNFIEKIISASSEDTLAENSRKAKDEFNKRIALIWARVKQNHTDTTLIETIKLFFDGLKNRYTPSGKLIYTRNNITDIDRSFDEKF